MYSGPDLVVMRENVPLEYNTRCEDMLAHHRDDVSRANISKLCGPHVPLAPTTVWGFISFHQRAVTWFVDTYTASESATLSSDEETLD